MQPSVAMREYLAEIYRLQEYEPTVSTTSLADRLNVSAPAIPRMLKRLKSSGYVKHIPYQGVELTRLGEEEALQEIRRHRILEVFLVKIMEFSWDEVHEHADVLSRGLNNQLSTRMDEMTGYPTSCPHGEPIPDANGLMPEINDICIINLNIGHRGEVSRVRTDDPEKLRYFATLNLMPGTSFEIMGRAPFNGPIRLRVERDEIVLGMELTKSLWVT